MKFSTFFLGTLFIGLTGCQSFKAIYPSEKPQATPRKLEQLSEFGAKFAREYSGATKEVCTKYAQLYQEGDWRAGWILAIQTTETKSEHCLSSEEAIQILITLESEKKINPELLWLTHVHLNWLERLEQHTKNLNQLKRIISEKQAQIIELEKVNQNLVEKLEALKAIETSINQ